MVVLKRRKQTKIDGSASGVLGAAEDDAQGGAQCLCVFLFLGWWLVFCGRDWWERWWMFFVFGGKGVDVTARRLYSSALGSFMLLSCISGSSYLPSG